jgi:hypothetical protein
MKWRTRTIGLMGVTALVGLGANTLVAMPAGAAKTSLSAYHKDLLKLSDMPKHWTSSGSISTETGGQFPGGAQLASCIGVPLSVIDNSTPTLESQQFSTKNDQYVVQDNVTVNKTTAGAKADYDSDANPKTPSCMSQDFNGTGKSSLDSEFGKGASVGTVQAQRLPASDFPKGTTNVEINFPLTISGSTLNVELIFTDFERGKLEQSVNFTGIASPFPTSLIKMITATANGRI